MDGLTQRQQQILDFIRGFVESEGMPPTRAELARAFGFKSPASAEEHLRALEKKGAITLSGMARGLRLTEPSGLPLVGQVAAGAPLLAAENVVGHYPVSPNLFKLRADYLLKVRGWSMRLCYSPPVSRIVGLRNGVVCAGGLKACATRLWVWVEGMRDSPLG